MARPMSLRALSSALLLALLIAALHPQPAFADDETPLPDPPGDQTTVVDPVVSAPSPLADGVVPEPPPPEAGPDPAPPHSDPAPVAQDGESAPATDSAPPAPATEPPAGEASDVPPAALLAALPDGTAVAAVDETGAILPLASPEAAEVLATGDPVWCPTGALPGAATCSASFANLAALVAGFVPTGNGVIWIEKGVDSSAVPIMIDDSGTWYPARTFSLTLQGGWNGPGTTTIDKATPSELHVPLIIGDWEGDITLNDLVFTGIPGPWEPIDISPSKKVTLNRVEVTNNANGAHIDNRNGASDVVVNAGSWPRTITGPASCWTTRPRRSPRA